jgi:hypothetical protein
LIRMARALTSSAAAALASADALAACKTARGKHNRPWSVGCADAVQSGVSQSDKTELLPGEVQSQLTTSSA